MICFSRDNRSCMYLYCIVRGLGSSSSSSHIFDLSTQNNCGNRHVSPERTVVFILSEDFASNTSATHLFVPRAARRIYLLFFSFVEGGNLNIDWSNSAAHTQCRDVVTPAAGKIGKNFKPANHHPPAFFSSTFTQGIASQAEKLPAKKKSCGTAACRGPGRREQRGDSNNSKQQQGSDSTGRRTIENAGHFCGFHHRHGIQQQRHTHAPSPVRAQRAEPTAGLGALGDRKTRTNLCSFLDARQ